MGNDNEDERAKAFAQVKREFKFALFHVTKTAWAELKTIPKEAIDKVFTRMEHPDETHCGSGWVPSNTKTYWHVKENGDIAKCNYPVSNHTKPMNCYTIWEQAVAVAAAIQGIVPATKAGETGPWVVYDRHGRGGDWVKGGGRWYATVEQLDDDYYLNEEAARDYCVGHEADWLVLTVEEAKKREANDRKGK